MNSIGIQTTQNVALDYKLAGVGSRIIAYIIDMLIVFAFYLFIILAILPATQGVFVVAVAALIGWLYFLLSEIFTDGQTIGKRAMKIKVIKTDGSKPSIGAYILRWIMIPIDFGIASGAVALLSIIVTEKGQRVGDILAGTTVVKLGTGSIHSLQRKKSLVQIDKDYTPTYPEADNLSEEEIRLIGKALSAFGRHGARKPVESLSIKIREKYGIQSADLPIRFLSTLQKDHAFYQREKDAQLQEDTLDKPL
jgi:uncharacterized RDD family membrane protein YckC